MTDLRSIVLFDGVMIWDCGVPVMRLFSSGVCYGRDYEVGNPDVSHGIDSRKIQNGIQSSRCEGAGIELLGKRGWLVCGALMGMWLRPCRILFAGFCFVRLVNIDGPSDSRMEL